MNYRTLLILGSALCLSILAAPNLEARGGGGGGHGGGGGGGYHGGGGGGGYHGGHDGGWGHHGGWDNGGYYGGGGWGWGDGVNVNIGGDPYYQDAYPAYYYSDPDSSNVYYEGNSY